MEFRKAIYSDIDRIMDIIKNAQDHFKSEGIDQWQNGYPNYEIIKEDILNENSYVLLDHEIIIGTVSLSFDGEKTYEKIYDGEWLSNEKYAVIHRMAIDINYKGLGLASWVVKNLEEICLNQEIDRIKVDTHVDNLPMTKVLKKNGFEYCGIIYLEDKSPRVAFEKKLTRGNILS
jgi:RimJ/RimL family protein N-acetyltransferase